MITKTAKNSFYQLNFYKYYMNKLSQISAIKDKKNFKFYSTKKKLCKNKRLKKFDAH